MEKFLKSVIYYLDNIANHFFIIQSYDYYYPVVIVIE